MDECDESGQEDRRRSPARSGRLQAAHSGRNQLTKAARSFRREPTASEQLLWQQLRRGRLQGCAFRRQHPIGPFIADFCCPVQSLIVEIDGAVHAGQQEADLARQRQLEARGYRVLRVTAHAVETRMGEVLQLIIKCLDSPQS